jgi:hypothetical protein
MHCKNEKNEKNTAGFKERELSLENKGQNNNVTTTFNNVGEGKRTLASQSLVSSSIFCCWIRGYVAHA